MPVRFAVIVPAVKLPLASRATIALAVFAEVAVVALFETFEAVEIVASLVSAMPALACKLLTSRLKRETYSVASEEAIDPTKLDASYATPQECRFLLSCCSGRATKGSLSFLGDGSILLQSSSKVFVHRDEDGNVLAVVIIPINGHPGLPSEILSAMVKSEYNLHSMNSNCEMKLQCHSMMTCSK